MAVIYYGEGTHDAGFVGFRVARTVGVADDYRQEYFSLREYSYATAHRLAYSLDRKWEAEAEEVKRQNKTCKRRRNSGPNIIAEGLYQYREPEPDGGEENLLRTLFSRHKARLRQWGYCFQDFHSWLRRSLRKGGGKIL